MARRAASRRRVPRGLGADGSWDHGLLDRHVALRAALAGGGRAHREPLVARIAPATSAVFPVYDLGRQFHVLRALAGTDVPVPEPLWLEEGPEPLGQPFFVMRQVQGRAAPDSPSYHAEGWLADAPAAEREAAWWDGIQVLSRIHGLDPDSLGLGFLAAIPEGIGPPVQTLDYYRGYLEWAAPERCPPAVTEALAWLERNRPAPPVRPSLCWGDARLGNMLFRGGRCVAVLDWEMATLGDPESDLGWWLYFDRHHSEGCGLPGSRGSPRARRRSRSTRPGPAAT